MKEKFFYKKREIIGLLNIPKKYPLVQIYAALTQLIEDNNEFITDKFGRTGYLVNIDEYYLFQPSELNHENISIFDRSVPIDYKHNMIKFDIKNEIQNEAKVKYYETKKEIPYTLKILKDKFNLAREFTKLNKKISSTEKNEDNNWYRNCGLAIRKLSNQGVKLEYLLEFLVEHIIDTTLFHEKIEILNYLYSLHIVEERTFEGLAKEYLDKKIIKTNKITAIILYDMDNRKIIKLDDNKNEWINAEPEDIRDLSENIKEKFSIKTSDFNNLLGFIGNDDKKKFMVFKLKYMKEKRHTGARCDQKTKAKILEIMNEIEGEEKYTKENTKGIIQSELCPLQEFILRNYNKIKKNGKIWFLDSETAKIYGF